MSALRSSSDMLKFVLALFVLVATGRAATNKVVCYFSSWATYRPGDGKFDVEDIDPHLCTHLVYSFVGLNGDSTINILDYQNSIANGAIGRFNALRDRNPDLKTLVAIGGWSDGSEQYSDMISSATTRAVFTASVVGFMEAHGFDGFDFDWEYPGQRGGRPEDKQNFVLLLAEMRPIFDQRGWLLTAAVAVASDSVDTSYDVPGLNRYLDHIHVMAYNLHGQWDNKTGQNAPLYDSPSDRTPLNVDASVRGWIERGASPGKLMMGLGSYGRSFTLTDSLDNHVGADTTGAGLQGPYTGESGILGYNEICLNVHSGWTVVWDDDQKVPYAYDGDQWVGYDNPTSIGLKVDYAKSMGLGGVMVWSVDTDDFRGMCGAVNPLLNQIRNGLESDLRL